MKEMYLKGDYFGKHLDMCYEDEYYGKFGELTDMSYEDASPLHTGDIVELRNRNGSIMGYRIVAHPKKGYGVVGVFSNKFINGKSGDWKIKLVCKYYDNNETKVKNIIIIDGDQFVEDKRELQTHQAITLLQSLGYKVEVPYVPPADSEIIARIVSENQKVGYVGKPDNMWYIRMTDEMEFLVSRDWVGYRSIGVTYTTQSIAQQIVEELNEKRFVRV